MVKHIVLWKLKEEVDRQKIYLLLRYEFAAFVSKVKDIESWSMSLAFDGYDIALEIIFKDRDALDRYMIQPEHLAFKKLPEMYREDRALCDYEY